jgi:hypothetical protein
VAYDVDVQIVVVVVDASYVVAAFHVVAVVDIVVVVHVDNNYIYNIFMLDQKKCYLS